MHCHPSQEWLAQAKDDWERDGFLLLADYLSGDEIARYRALCDGALEQWQAADPRHGDATNMAWLTEPRYWTSDRAGLLALCEWIADPSLLALLRHLAEEPILFNNTQYFAEPQQGRWHGLWHRDSQFLAEEDDRAERAAMAAFTGVHLHIAFVDDPALSFVPGSHSRFDRPEEYAVRRAADKALRHDGAMPGARRLRLKAGDAVLFHAWGIHRGMYDAEVPRRTFDAIYQWGGLCKAAPPPPTCFEDTRLLADMSPHARDFFGHFAESYRPFWNNGAHAWAM